MCARPSDTCVRIVVDPVHITSVAPAGAAARARAHNQVTVTGGPPAWRQIGRNVFRQEHAFREDSVLGIGHGFPRIAPGGFNFSDSGFNHIPFDCS